MARGEVLVLCLLAVLIVGGPPPAEGRKATRRLDDGYPTSGSSGVTSPYTSSPEYGSSPSLPDTTTPSPDISSTSPDISSTSPDISTPTTPDIYPSPDITTPYPGTSTPYTGYGGYGSHSGYGTPKFWRGNPLKVPKVLKLLSTLVKLFGPRLLKFIGNKTILGAIKDESLEPMPSLAREGAASLINAYAYQDFPLSAMQVISHFNNALSSPELAAEQALTFQRYNEAV